MPPPPANSAAPLLATSLLIAEFDIDTGACLRACYPPAHTNANPISPNNPAALYSVETAVPPGVAGNTEYVANVMLPDGAEKVNVTRTVFVLNRPQPRVFLRFPVYRFSPDCGETNTSANPSPSPSPTSPMPPMAEDSACRWLRAAGEATALYVPEMLLLDTVSHGISLRYKDTELEASEAVPMESIASFSAIPADVVRFTKQLEAMLMNEASLAGSTMASFAAAAAEPSSVPMDGAGAGSTGAMGGRGAGSGLGAGSGSTSGGNGGAVPDYAFVAVDYPSGRRDGYLMRNNQFERLLRALTTMVQQEAADAAAATEAAVQAKSATQREDTTASVPPPHGADNTAVPSEEDGAAAPVPESGPLGSFDPNNQHRDGLQTTLSDPLLYPHSESAEGNSACPTSDSRLPSSHGADGLVLLDGVTPPSPETGVNAEVYTPTSAMLNQSAGVAENNYSGHLLLPRTESTSSSVDGEGWPAQGRLSGTAEPQGNQLNAPVSGLRSTVPRQATLLSTANVDARGTSTTESSGPVLFGLCAVVSKRDSTARRGGITKSVAVLGPSLVWLEPFFPVLVAAAQYSCGVSGTNDESITELQRILKMGYISINNAAPVVAAGRAKVDQLTSEIGKYCTLSSGQQAYVYYNDAPFGETIKAKIPLSPESNDIVFSRYSLENLIETLGAASMQLILGILTEKKILILSRKGEASDVCEVALSLGIIGNLLDRGFMAKKVFPYVSVSSVDHFLHVPGYVVGTLNPIFENVTPWSWDLLCDLDNKTVTTAAERMLRRPGATSASAGGNWATATAGLANAVGVATGAEAEALRNLPPPIQQLYKALVRALYHLRALRIGAVERNRRLRLVLEDFLYTSVFVGYVAGGEVTVPSALYPLFAHRSMAVLRREMALTSMLDNVRTHMLHPGESPALLLYCAALRYCSSSDTPVQRILQSLLSMLTSVDAVKIFLRRMTLAVGGLNAVGMQLTHPSAETRAAATALLARVESIPEGKASAASMNNFFLMIYENRPKVLQPK